MNFEEIAVLRPINKTAELWATCLWLKALPSLQATDIVEGRGGCRWHDHQELASGYLLCGKQILKLQNMMPTAP